MKTFWMVGALLTAGLAGTAHAQSGAASLGGGMVWELQGLTDGGQAVNFSPSLKNPTLQFDGTNASGKAPCNVYRAAYTATDTTLKFGPLISTRIACPELPLEQRYLNLLGSATGYRVANSVLTLTGAQGGQLVFRQRSGAKSAQPVQPATVQPGASVPTATAPSASAAVLKGTSWRLMTLNGRAPITAVPVSFRFDGAQLSGSDGCNSYGGEAKTDGTTIRATSPIIQTEKACLTGSADKVPSLPALLQRGASYRLSGPTLTLTGDGNAWVFAALVTTQTAPATPPSPPTQPSAPVNGTVPANAPLPSAVTLFDRASTAGFGPDEDLYIVGPVQQDCTGVAAGRCLIVKQPGETAWKLMSGQIEGFTFRPGVISLLRVRVERVTTVQADGSNVRYRLVRVLGTQLVR